MLLKKHINLLIILFVLFIFSCKHLKTKQVLKNDRTIEKEKTNSAINQLIKKLGLTATEINKSKLHSFILDWYSVPYKYGGCLKSGVDCSCFVSLLYKQVYDKDTDRTANDIYLACNKVNISKAKEGDFVFFKIKGDKVSHMGLYLNNNFFVHASSSKGVIISNLEETYYKKYFFCIGKFNSK